MSSTYTDIAFTSSQPDQSTAMKLNKLRDDLSAAISSIGGYYTDTWRWTTNTANAAVSGEIGINAANWSAATFLNLSEFSAAGVDKTIQMDKAVAAGNSVLIKDAANANNYAEYTITGPGVDMGTWRQYPVSMAKVGGVLPKNGANTTLTIYVQGASGGAGTGDMTKAIYDTDNNGKVDTCDSLPWGSVTGKPATIGDMLKSVYDTNGDGISDHAAQADSVPWTGVTGRPSVFPPDSTAMLKSVYDTNGDGVSDHAALSDTAPWTGITGKPATFPPDSTAMLKATYDVNANGVVDTCDSLAWGKLTGVPATFPPDSTAMLKSVYDTNGDSISDHAALADTAPWTGITGKPATFSPSAHASTHLAAGSDPIALATSVLAGLCPAVDNTTIQVVTSKLSCVALAWTAITGKPATFPPDSTAMLKSVYDTNADNIVDHAALADAAPWTGITGKPATFAPSAHGTTHLDNGSDPISVVTTSRTGLAPVLSGNAATYLNGTGTYSAVSGSVNPGTWTNLSLGTGWTAPTQAQYRVEVNGAVSTVYFRGMIQAAYSAIGTTAFTLAAGAFPSMTRQAVLGGAQNTGTATDVASYIASVSSAGVCTIYALTAGPFVWYDPAQTQQIYIDGLSYSL